jgi:hypothetical protein
MGWSDTSRRKTIIRKVTDWMKGLNNPKEDGEILPLTDLILRLSSEGGRPYPVVKAFLVTEHSDAVELVDEILEELEFHAEDKRKNGDVPAYLLTIHFANRKVQECEITLAPQPNLNQEEQSFPSTNLRDPRNMAATMVQMNCQQAMHNATLVYGTLQGLFTKYSEIYEKQELSADKKDKRIESLEAKLDAAQKAAAEREERVKALEVDLQIKHANAQLLIGLKKMGAEALFPVLQQIGVHLAKKTGTMMGIQEIDINETQMKLAKHISARPELMQELTKDMDDELKGQLFVAFQAMEQKAAKKQLAISAQAGMEGIARPLTVAKFDSMVRSLNQQKKVG